MQLSLKLSIEQCNIILKGLNELPRKEGNDVYCFIVEEFKKEEDRLKNIEAISEENFDKLPKELVEN
jgi:hypothetical protein